MYRTLIRVVAVCSVAFACGDKGGVPDAGVIDATPPGGTVTLTWKLVDGADGLICDDIGAVALKVVAEPIDAIQGAQFSFNCKALTGTSIELPPATYNLRIDLLGTGLKKLTESVRQNGVVVTSGQDTAIPEITFDIRARGSVTFSIDTNEMAGNCAAATSGGAQIAEFGLRLTDLYNNCKNATFEIPNPAAGGGVDTYVSDCGTGDTVDLVGDDDCIENDVTITIVDVESGESRLVIEGYQDGVADPCYAAFFNFSVLGGDNVLEYGERRIARQSDNGPCAFPAQ